MASARSFILTIDPLVLRTAAPPFAAVEAVARDGTGFDAGFVVFEPSLVRGLDEGLEAVVGGSRVLLTVDEEDDEDAFEAAELGREGMEGGGTGFRDTEGVVRGRVEEARVLDEGPATVGEGSG